MLFLLDNALAYLPVGIDHYSINCSVGSVSRLLKQFADFGVKSVVFCHYIFHFVYALQNSGTEQKNKTKNFATDYFAYLCPNFMTYIYISYQQAVDCVGTTK
jgi:hypothetical protein